MTETLILNTRPLTVEARHVTAENRGELAEWVHGWTFAVHAIRWFDMADGNVRQAAIGEWVVHTAFGQFEPYTDNRLFAAFDRIRPVVEE